MGEAASPAPPCTPRSAPRTRPAGPVPCASGRGLPTRELCGLGGAVEGNGGRLLALDRAGDRVEVAGPDLALVAHRGEATLRGRELGLLQLHERAHLPARVPVREFEHAVVERVEAGQCDELEAVAHRRQLLLEA